MTAVPPPGAPSAWSGVRRVLGVRLDAMGDVLMTTPALRALRGGGHRHVTLLTSPAGARAAALVPDVDAVVAYEAPWMKATPPRAGGAADRAMVKRLRAGGFEAAVIFTVYSQNPLPAALMAMMADVPRRLAHCRENPYQLLTDWVPETEPDRQIRHEVRRQLDLVAAVGAATADERLSLAVPAAARRHVRALLAERGLADGRRWVAVHPGSSAPSRRYPARSFAAAARRLVRDFGCAVVFTGTAEERPVVAEVQEAMQAPSCSLAGALDLDGLAALLAEAPVFLSNNSGPVHVAAAVGTPVVDLYALTNPQHTPWGVPSRVLFHDVPCKYCYRSACPAGHHDCLRRVSPEEVVRAVLALMGESLRGRPPSSSGWPGSCWPGRRPPAP